MIRKIITYGAIIFLVMHFSISGAYASEINEEAVLPQAADESGESTENSTEEASIETPETIGSPVQSAEEPHTEADLEQSEEASEAEEPEEKQSAKKEKAEPSAKSGKAEKEDSQAMPAAESKEKVQEIRTFKAEENVKMESQANEIMLFSARSTGLPYKKGDNHDAITEVKVMLNALGFNGIAETGNYGNFTVKRVKEFQKYYGLAASGEVDQKTLDKLNEIYHSPYQKGNSNERTAEVKRLLNGLGYGRLAEGPVFGNLTERRVKQFQADHGLRAHGIVDDLTYEKLKALSKKTAKKSKPGFGKGDSHEDVIVLKQKLNRLGFDGIAETKNYGSFTAKRVKEFQSYYGLKATGVADEQTLKKLDEVYNSPYQTGKKHQYTAEIKKKLNALGYRGLAETPAFGSFTEKRLMQFQRDHGLKAHGIADEPTLAKLDAAFDKTEYAVGDRHPGVIPIKQKLNALGFNGIAETAVYGKHTAKRVSEFQEYYGLPVTGIADLETQQKLDEIINSPYQAGNSDPFIADIKKMLHLRGYNGLREDAVFGSLAEQSLKDFQSARGLIAHGIADEKTIEQLESGLLKVGDNDPKVTEMKRNLNLLGYDGLAETPVFGNFTKKRLAEFQKDHGLLAYGFADEETFAKLESLLENYLKKGDNKPEVIAMKEKLNALGYDKLALSENFGSFTATRVKQFQRDNGLPATGAAGPKTLEKLDQMFTELQRRNQPEPNAPKVKIFIDPGHGGHDPGASSKGVREKDVVLDIGLKVAEELKGYTGVDVMLSRATDNFLSLSQRTTAANSWGADFFLSLHINAFNGVANGFESFIFNGPTSQETKDRQTDIHNHLADWLAENNGIKDRGAQRQNFHVLRRSAMPALLLEYMFIDHPKENNLLQSKSYRSTLGTVTADAIAKSFNLIKK